MLTFSPKTNKLVTKSEIETKDAQKSDPHRQQSTVRIQLDRGKQHLDIALVLATILLNVNDDTIVIPCERIQQWP